MNRKIGRFTLHRALALTLPITALAACQAGGASDSGTAAEQALAEAQASYDDMKAEVEGCFGTFEGCMQDPAADEAACRSALESCLPARPPPPSRCEDDGEQGGNGAGGAASSPEEEWAADAGDVWTEPDVEGSADADASEEADASEPEGTTEDSDATEPEDTTEDEDASKDEDTTEDEDASKDEDADHPRHERDSASFLARGMGHKGPPSCDALPLALPEALRACHAELKSCRSTAEVSSSCRDAHHACIRAAAGDAFGRYCERAQSACDAGALPESACAHIVDRCAQGLEGG